MITDAASPQVNGVVTTIRNTIAQLQREGHAVTLITPADFATIACPVYPEIRLAVLPARRLADRLRGLLGEPGPTFSHICTEGPLGLAARNFFVRRGLRFTTSYHTDLRNIASAT
jgi:hypothetical protein